MRTHHFGSIGPRVATTIIIIIIIIITLQVTSTTVLQGRKAKSFNERADLLSRYKLLPIRFNSTHILFYIVIYEQQIPKQSTIRLPTFFAVYIISRITSGALFCK